MKKTPSLISLFASYALANIADYNFSYQDYLDFGQNRGKFTPQATNLSIIEKNKTIHPIPVPMPDLVGKVDSQSGIMTFMGGSYVYTAAHTRIQNAFFFGEKYIEVDFNEKELTQGDLSYVRYGKFITAAVKADYLEVSRENDPLVDRDRFTHYFRSGAGTAMYRKADGSMQKIQNSGIRTGGMQHYDKIISQDNFIKIMTAKASILPNPVTKGDSGSPLWVYDNQNQKWYVVGSASRANLSTESYYAVYRQSFLDELIERNTNPTITLNGSSALWEDQNILAPSKLSATNNASKNKDIVLKGGGSITLTSNIDQGHGGIYFDSHQTYIITSPLNGSNSPYSWKGGGLHIDKNTIVHWRIKGVAGIKDPNNNRPGGGYLSAPDSLHKIGEGTLSVEVFNGGWLNLGEGKVILNPNDTSKPTFEHIVLVSGRPTLELTEGKGEALDTDKFFFAFRGGTLDIKGNDLVFNTINASDNGANLINTGSKQAKITIKKQMLNAFDMLIPGSGEFLYHGNIGNNILIFKDGESQDKCTSSPEFCLGYGENLLAFDGNILNPDGGIKHINGKLVLQGHPVIHAYLPYGTAQQISSITGDDIYSTPTRITQQDWEKRFFILNQIDISKDKNDSTFILGRDAILLTNLYAKDTQVFFGGREELYVDAYDGENTSYSVAGQYTRYSFKQKLSKGINQKDQSFYFEGNIIGENNTLISIQNTSTNPIRFGSFQGFDRSKAQEIQALFTLDGEKGLQNPLILTPVSYQVKLDPSSEFKAKYISLYGENQVIFDTLPTTSSFETSNSYANFTIEHLSLHQQSSIVQGNLTITPLQETQNNQSSILFTNLYSTLKLKGGILNLSAQTKLYFDFATTSLKDLTYNTPYSLILSDQIIQDQREHKDIAIFSSASDDFALPKFLTPNTFNQDHSIGLIFQKTQSSSLSQYDWFENYILGIIQEKDLDLADQKLQSVLEAIGDNRPMLEAIVANNLTNDQKYYEVDLDRMIFETLQGNHELANFSSSHTQSVENIAREGIVITSRLLNNITSFNLYRNSLLALNAKTGSNPTSTAIQKARPRLALNLIDLPSLARSDFDSKNKQLEVNLFHQASSLSSSQKHNLWITPQGSYFFLGGQYFNAGVSGGYDYLPIATAQEFLSFGLSLHYAYTEFKQNKLQESGNATFIGSGIQYHNQGHEILACLYGGILQEDLILQDSYLSSSPIKHSQNTYALQLQALYKYAFVFNQNKSKHFLKPVGGVEISYYHIPQGAFEWISYEKLNPVIPTLNLGIEYNFLTQSTQNIISILFKHNFIYPQDRSIYFGIIPLPSSLTQTDFQQSWIELSYNGNYRFSEVWSIDYSLLASLSTSQWGYFGIGGNIGVSWRF